MDLFGAEIEDFPAEDAVSHLDEEISDALGDPRHSTKFIGHQDIEQHLLSLYQSDRMPHGLIFAGPKGIGKSTFAFRFARFLLAHKKPDPNQDSMFAEDQDDHQSFDVSPDHPVFKRIASGGHSDLMTLERTYDAAKNQRKSTLDVEQVRKVAPFIRMTAAEDGWRVVIIDDADTMNRNAQNALLKILEEPPKNALLILITHRPGALIPTIRSRTQSLSFSALGLDQMKDLIGGQCADISSDGFEKLCVLSQGSPGKALQIKEQGGLESLQRLESFLQSYPDFSYSNIYILADELSRPSAAAEFEVFQYIMLQIVRLGIFAKARQQASPNKLLESEPLQGFMQKLSLEALLKICENLKTHFDHVKHANLERRFAVIEAFNILKV